MGALSTVHEALMPAIMEAPLRRRRCSKHKVRQCCGRGTFLGTGSYRMLIAAATADMLLPLAALHTLVSLLMISVRLTWVGIRSTALS